MPAEKRWLEHLTDDAASHPDPKLRRCEVAEQVSALAVVVEEANSTNNDDRETPPLPASHHHHHHHQGEGTEEPKLDDSNDAVLQEDSDSSNAQDPPEFVFVDLQSIRKEVQCPICLGIIKKTRTVMECLHRFCRECIDKSMRMGNNECPACRTHCASRRSLRDDPRFDELIADLYPDIKKFEEEELAFYEEDEARNKQIQESITQVLIKQSEALGKKRPANKDSAGPSGTRSQRKNQSSYPRRKRRRRNSSMEYQYQDSDDNDDTLNIDKQVSPNEHHREIKPRKAKTRSGNEVSHSPSATNVSGGSIDNNVEESKEERGLSSALTCGTEKLSWGRGGARSNTRHGNVNDGMSKHARRMRLAKLVDFLHNLDENDDEFSTSVKDENFQLMGTPDGNGSPDPQSVLEASSCNDKQSQVAQLLHGSLHILEIEGTTITPGTTVASCISNEQPVLAYPDKEAV